MSKFRLNISIRVEQLHEQGYPVGGALEIREDQVIEAETFMEVAKILGQFDDLAKAMARDPVAR